MRLSPFLALLFILSASAQEGIPYRNIPAETGNGEGYVEIPAGALPQPETGEEGFVEVPAGVVEDPQAFFEVAPDGFSDGSEHDQPGYREGSSDGLRDQSGWGLPERKEAFVNVPPSAAEEPQPFLEVNPDRFSGGSRDGRTVYREMDHDDLDNETMAEVKPADDPNLQPAAPTVVPADETDPNPAVVVPVDRISSPQPGQEDRIFQKVERIPPAPGAPGVPDQERVYIPPN